MDLDDTPPEPPFGIDPAASRRIFLGMLALIAGGAMASLWARPRPGPPPAAIAGDPQLVRGRLLYLEHCAGCHGPEGRGDGPTAATLSGPKPGDLTDADWKNGDRPDQVERVIADGVRDAAMPGWGPSLGPEGVRDVAAYVYHLAGRPVPWALRGDRGPGLAPPDRDGHGSGPRR